MIKENERLESEIILLFFLRIKVMKTTKLSQELVVLLVKS